MADVSEEVVYFMCVKEGKKLRIRVTTPGYNSCANCQFPRNIREDGGVYSAPSSAVRFGKGPAGKFFYRVSAKFVTKINEKIENKINVSKIYENDDEECIVCMDKVHDVIIVPCGHYCLCSICASKIKSSSGSCPMCRGTIELIVTKDQIQE